MLSSTLNFIGLTRKSRRESKFGEVALSIVQILETFRRQRLVGRSPEQSPDQSPEQSPVSIEEVKAILSKSRGGLNWYLETFNEMALLSHE